MRSASPEAEHAYGATRSYAGRMTSTPASDGFPGGSGAGTHRVLAFATRALRGDPPLLLAAAAAILSGGGSAFVFLLEVPIASLIGIAAGAAVASPALALRITACVISAFLGLFLASAGLYLSSPGLLGGAGAVAVLVWGAAWRESFGARAKWWHAGIAGVTSAAALLSLYVAFGQIGAEGGFCWFDGFPPGCLPTELGGS